MEERRFKLSLVTDSEALLTYDEVKNFGEYLLRMDRESDDKIFMYTLEDSIFDYCSEKISINIEYIYDEYDDKCELLVTIFDIEDDNLLYVGPELLEEYLDDDIEDYRFRIPLEEIEDVIDYDFVEDGIDPYMEKLTEVFYKEDEIKNICEKIFKAANENQSLVLNLKGEIIYKSSKNMMFEPLEKGDMVIYWNYDDDAKTKVHCGIMEDDTLCKLYTTPNKETRIINIRIKARYLYIIKKGSSDKIYVRDDEDDEGLYLEVLDEYVNEMGKRIKIIDEDI